MLLCGKKGKQWIFQILFKSVVSKTVGRCSQISTCMNLYEYQRSRSFIDLCTRSLRFNIFKLFSLKNTRLIEAIFHVEPSCDGRMKRVQMVYDLFYGKVRFGPLRFCIGKTMNLSEINVVYDINVSRCSQLNECLKLYEYQRSSSFIDLGPNHSDSMFLIFFSSVTA